METIYLCIIIFLFVLAIFDLIVGVSNDAVNFLNSAVGAKAASFKTIQMCIRDRSYLPLLSISYYLIFPYYQSPTISSSYFPYIFS